MNKCKIVNYPMKIRNTWRVLKYGAEDGEDQLDRSCAK